MNQHIPVLLNECISFIVVKPGGSYFEGTIGYGGHTEKILEHLSVNARYTGTDKDVNAFEHCVAKFKSDVRIQLYNTSFVNIDVVSRLESIKEFDAIFVDLRSSR